MLNIKLPDISLLPKEYTAQTSFAEKRAGFLSIALYIFLFLILAGWGGLYFYGIRLQDDAEILNERMKMVPIQGRESEVAKINEMNKKIASLKGILDNHIFASNIFKKIEDSTLKRVYFDRFDIDPRKLTLSLSGVADSYTTFAKQFSEFNKLKDEGIFRKVDSESIKFTKDGVEFGFNIALYAKIFKK